MAGYDTSVRLRTMHELYASSELPPDDFEKSVFEAMSAGRSIRDLGCGRVLADWSGLMRTKYVLCDIYEADPPAGDKAAPYRYRMEIKVGDKTGIVGDAVYCVLFLSCFWFLWSFFAKGFSPLFLILAGIELVVGAALLLSPKLHKFGAEEAVEVLSDIMKSDKLTVENSKAYV